MTEQQRPETLREARAADRAARLEREVRVNLEVLAHLSDQAAKAARERDELAFELAPLTTYDRLGVALGLARSGAFMKYNPNGTYSRSRQS